MDDVERSDGTIQSGGNVTRRTIVRTTAHAAWVAPVILAATAAPAMAASGAAVITATTPSFTIPQSHIRASLTFSNSGTVAPASMTVTVTIMPLQGTLQDVDPRINPGTEFALNSRVVNADGSHTITFTKLDPQIPASGSAPFSIDFFQDPDPTTGFRTGIYTVVPSVPFPGQATGSTQRYNSTVS